MGQREEIELKFRIYDGTDIGHHSYAPSMTVANLKKRLLAEWPQAKTVTPKSANEVKLIHSGRVLENNKTLADSRITSANQPGGGAVIMHAVVQPLVPKQKKTDKNQKDMQKMNSCSCTLLSSLSNPKDRHELVRQDVKQVVCSVCNTEQQVAQLCSNCGVNMGEYYCDICKFYDDDISKQQFHCNECGICRVGGRDHFFHCQKCGSCYVVELRDNHLCVENSMKNHCPVCYEYLFDSVKGTTIMKCGHTMHSECFIEMQRQTQYRCPICSKTIRDMDSIWRLLDDDIEATAMPEEYQYEVSILCNDCNTTSNAPFHIFGLKCSNCDSYNTRRISAADHQ